MWRAVLLLFAGAAAQSSLDAGAPKLNLDDFYTYDGMVSYLRNLSQSFSGNMFLKTLTTTAENRSVYLVKVYSDGTHCPKKVILLDAASHGNEWITTTVALKAIHELVVNGHRADNYNLLERSDWYILPMVNPDGYEYSLSTQNHDWKKNRSPNGLEFGANLNRNFDSNWNESRAGESASPWSQDYRGNKTFSEPESWAIGDLMQEVVADKREFLYISLHTENKSSIFYPYVFAGNLSKNNATLQAIAQYASELIWVDTKPAYNHSLPLAYKGVGGTSLDYAYEQGIPLAFDLEFFQAKADGQSMTSFIANRTFEGWSGVFHLAEGALRTLTDCDYKDFSCGCIENDDLEDYEYYDFVVPPDSDTDDVTPTQTSVDDSDYSGDCDDCHPSKHDTDKQASAAGELSPLIGVLGTLLTYLSYTLLG